MRKNSLLEAIFQTSSLFIGVLDEKGRLIDANQKALDFIERSLEEVQGVKFWNTPWWNHSKSLREKLKEEINQPNRGEEVRIEADHFSPEGEKVTVDFILRTVETEDGKTRFLALGRDITDLKQVKKKHQIVTEGSSQALYLFQDGEFKFVNESFVKLIGYTEEELSDIGFLELIHPDDREKIAKWTRQALTGDDSGLPERVEYKVSTKKGETIWLRTLPSIITYEGRPAIVGNAVNITKEKEIEEELRSEKELMKSIMTLTPDLVYFKDDQHRFKRVSEGYTNLLNLDEEEMIGKTAEDFWPEAEEIMEDERQALSGEPVIGREREVTLPDGKKRWYSTNKLPRRDGEGNVIGFLGMDRDITERKEIEKKLNDREREMSLLLSNLPGMAYRCKNDKHWTMQFVSEGCKDLTGYRPEELIDNEVVSFGSLVIEEDRERVWRDIQEQLDSNSPYRLEYRIRTKSGNQKWVWEQGRGIFDEYGKLQNLQGFIADITEKKRTEQALSEERNKLKNLHNAVNELQRQDTEDEILQTAVDVAENILDFKFCDISLVEGDYLVPKASATGLNSEESVTFEIGEGITGQTIQKGETIWGNDLRNFSEAKPTNEDFRAFISVPIGNLGIFQVISEEIGSFNQRDVELAEILAGHLQEEINRSRLEKELREQAIRDPLTDLYNRRYFNETLKKEVQKVKRYEKPLAFLMIDVNRFKEINDRYSHQIGDEVLQEVACLLKENVRDADTVVRYGGDEFLVMMPETEREVEEVVNRLQHSLEQWNKQTSLIDFPLTLAMGISHWSSNQDRDVEEALKEADREMYEDKV
ncbi:PAS domain S-box protein [Candidatus Bipolaricaulota bacterium]|nr:PAS domain S-box protein [Candidatus Bipolaricaulota bacterium]